MPAPATTDHQSNPRISEAAQFLATTPPIERPKPLLPALKAMFNLSLVEAVESIRESRLIRARST